MGDYASKLPKIKTAAAANRFAVSKNPKTTVAQTATAGLPYSGTAALQHGTALPLEKQGDDQRESAPKNAFVLPAPFGTQVVQRQRLVGPYMTNQNPTNLRNDNLIHTILAKLQDNHGVSVIPKGTRESFFGTPFNAKEHSWVKTIHQGVEQRGWIEDSKLTKIEPLDQDKGKSPAASPLSPLSSSGAPHELALVADLMTEIPVRKSALSTHEDYGESDEDRNGKIREFNNALLRLQRYASSPEGRMPSSPRKGNVEDGGTISSYSRAGAPVIEELMTSAREKGYELGNKKVYELLMVVGGLKHSLGYIPMRVL